MLKKIKAFVLVSMVPCLFCSFPAEAGSVGPGDMFYDRGWVPYNRPFVPSDLLRGADLFPPVPLFYNRNADVFDHMRAPYDFGREDMFVPRPKVTPPYPLFDYPKK